MADEIVIKNIMTKPLPQILDELEGSIKLADLAVKDAREAAEEARKAGEKAASEAARVAEEKIEKVAACWASPWVNQNKIVFMDEKGVTRAFKAGREFELLHENKLDDRFWASVAVAGDAYLFKGDKRLYCIKY